VKSGMAKAFTTAREIIDIIFEINTILRSEKKI
jgi:hypothetical protein